MAEAGFYPNSSTMHLHNALYDGEAQSRASLRLGDRIIHLLEFLENFCLIGFVDARSRVLDGKFVEIPFASTSIRTSPASVNLIALPTRLNRA